MSHEFHLSDRELLMFLDGELSSREAERAESHLTACWACRARGQELEQAIVEFVRVQREEFESAVSPADGPRSHLKAQLRRLNNDTEPTSWLWLQSLALRSKWAAIIPVLLLAGTAAILQTWKTTHDARLVAVTLPDPSLTPGATVLVGPADVCRQESVKNKSVPIAVRRKILAEYGLGSVKASAYEIDYLITPALGGADDIHNLWPESSEATVWNAQVKDSLEDHLRSLVCGGQLDLATAQREIAGNWIEAYKKYFNTEQPIAGSY